MFCVYLTTYMGDKLPPFYIGSTSVKKLENGYRGSVSSKRYKELWNLELKENPHLFKYQILQYCETRKEAYFNEEYWQRQFGAIKNVEFINCSYANTTGFFGKDTEGIKSWNGGLTKDDHPSIALIGQKNSVILKGRTKETHQYLMDSAIKQTGRNIHNYEPFTKMAENQRGRSKDTHEYLRINGEKRKGLTKETSDFYNEISIKNNILPLEVRVKTQEMRKNKIKVKDIHLYVLSLGYEISYRSIVRISKKDELEFFKTTLGEEK